MADTVLSVSKILAGITAKSECKNYELLIIDDLGVERNSEYALENIFSVIDWRYRSGRPLITTTNLPLVQLKQETKIGKKRIYDRILERCIPVKIDGVSRREAMANDNMQTMKNILKS